MEEDVPISFQRLIALRRVADEVYESLTPAFSPGDIPSMGKRAYGGHVYAQAVWAASQTVDKSFHVHNVNGHFLLGGRTDVPFTYHVKRVRDGYGYCLRSVEVFQQSKIADGGKSPCFHGTISFKRSEGFGKYVEYRHQNAAKDHIWKEYDVVLRGKTIEDHPHAPGFDAEWLPYGLRNETRFPGCDMRKVDMAAYNGVAITGGGEDGQQVSRWRQLLFYRLLQDKTGLQDDSDLNLHLAAHSYASDRNGLFLVQRAFGYEYCMVNIGSLAHTVIFHGTSQNLNMLDAAGRPKWFVLEAWSTNSGDNRITHNSRIWEVDTGIVIATTMQDGMMRVPANEDSKL